MTVAAPALTVKRGKYLTDGKELIQVASVTQKGVRIENVLTLEKRLVPIADLVARWREVVPRGDV